MELSEGHKSRCSMTTDEYGKEGRNIPGNTIDWMLEFLQNQILFGYLWGVIIIIWLSQ